MIIDFAALFRDIDISIVVYEPLPGEDDFVVCYRNPAADSLCSRIEVGMHTADIFGDVALLDESGTLFELLGKVRDSGVPQRFTLPLCSIDATDGWRDGYAYRLESGHVVIRCMGVNAAGCSRFAEHEQRSLRVILDTAPIGIWSQDETGRMQFVNRAFCEAVGISEREFLAVEHYGSLYTPETAAACIESDRTCLSSALPSIGYERLPFVDGKIHELMIIKTRVTDAAGNIRGLVGLSVDMTEKLETKRQLQAMNRTLEMRITEELERSRQKDNMLFQQQKLAAMGEMISNIAHQWRQPLNTLGLLLTDLSFKLMRYPEASAVCGFETYSGRASEIIQYLSDTIDDFRFFYREESGTSHFCTKELETSLEHLVKHSLLSGRISFMTDFEEAQIPGYQNTLKQALINLYTNASNAIMQQKIPEGKIWSKGFVEGSDYVIRVEDNGGGIAPEILDKIFEPYFTTRHKSQGTGLGLYMTRQIIENKFQGSIEVANGVEGACFTIRLPLER